LDSKPDCYSKSGGRRYTLYVFHFPLLLFMVGIDATWPSMASATLLVLVLSALIGPRIEKIAPFTAPIRGAHEFDTK
jgi:hypothetical protein